VSESIYTRGTTLTLAIRFVDRDMFMRYRGGGIGHKYMREVEAKYENMSLERDHYPKPSRSDNTGACGTSSGGTGPKPPNQSGSANAGGARSDGDESGDEDYVPPEMDDSDDDYSTVCDEDSGDDSGMADSVEDSDEMGSDGGYESYGLADL